MAWYVVEYHTKYINLTYGIRRMTNFWKIFIGSVGVGSIIGIASILRAASRIVPVNVFENEDSNVDEMFT